MKYIIFDLEFNTAFEIDKKTKRLMKGKSNPLCPQEIIEIGAVKLNSKLEIEDTFEFFVQPKLYKKLHPKVKQKTKITKEDIMNGLPFNEVIKLFKDWINEEDFVLCSWGKDDINELQRNCAFFKIKTNWIKQFCDIQNLCMKYLNGSNSQQIGLKNAVKEFNIDIDSQFHKALNDSIYTAKIFKEIKYNRNE
ncbi:3'-5' exonuclease [Serpentinicella alkaliphila]|uniref:Inhibitor of KinA sporulation pathway (Predicted exonuclease) n=1 Tax=Serpentinicella alkaliphila TaxID=1734049 RepID=A0A4V2T3Y4_9FIRM|nr:3'-5' exonuclease [Serpentinicella alkaliphila]QUH26630.1 exonuclease domain-containing protein [Serpentinicella alkaliphila]TCQ02904.1 inhibitor of KinA sporulation pathway (predicted exonuclease) [Serpentinicella alkaliphila]